MRGETLGERPCAAQHGARVGTRRPPRGVDPTENPVARPCPRGTLDGVTAPTADCLGVRHAGGAGATQHEQGGTGSRAAV